MLQHTPYCPYLYSPDYNLLSLMVHDLSGMHITNFEAVQHSLDKWFRYKDASLYRRSTYEFSERCQKCSASEGRTFNKTFLVFLVKFSIFYESKNPET